MKTNSSIHYVLRAIALATGAIWLPTAMGQVSTNVTVNVNVPLTYGNGAATATMPMTGLGLGTSVYANQWGNPALPGLIAGSGTQMLRYPGGSYSDIYNWSLGTANDGGYAASNSNIGNYFKVLDQSQTQGMVTVNYGSNTTATMGAPPQEAAAEVAYANTPASIYGTAADVTLGVDAAGVNWQTAGFWAKVRASTPAQYQSWATAAGVYNPSYSFLAINHSTPENIKYWEIGNEIGGNGYYGYQWEYDLHAPYNNGNTGDNTGRFGNPLLSPTAYAQNLNQFATLMKQVDPSIKIGAGFNAAPNDAGDKAILQTAGNNIDFGIIHWYPGGALPGTVTTGSGSLPTEINNVRTSVQNYTSKGYNGIQITVTEFGYSASNGTPIQNALFAADAYATGFENGVVNMDFQEMSSGRYLGDGPLKQGEVYYAMQMVHNYSGAGGTFVATSYNDSSIRVHAEKRADGSVALLLINDASATNQSQDRNLTISLTGGGKYLTTGDMYLFNNNNIGSSDTPPSFQELTGLGPTLSVTVPQQSMEVVILNPVLAGDMNRDGHITSADILPMMQALTNPQGYESTYGVNAADLQLIGDTSGDSVFTNSDLQSLLNLLKSGGGTADSVPEPASWVLVLLAVAIVSGTRFYLRCVR
jgi:hypothetical protein